MDRNKGTFINGNCNFTVALRKESVDRNEVRITTIDSIIGSLSARRAWIEILSAVLTELLILLSLSARRAWIEISPAGCWRDARRVALRKESVDRNLVAPLLATGGSCRSPQGERG